MSKPTQSIFPLENARLTTPLDCNNLQLLNLDESNLSGGNNGGNDTGTTMAILKGDGNHGFADAVAGTDYATQGAVDLKEDTATHDADILTLTTAVDLTEADIVTLTTAVGTKASTAALTAGLALKADDADLQAYITSNDADVALKAYTADITTALGNKADSASVSAALAGKEPTLPTTLNDRYILARRNASGTDAWFFVDPTTLGTTSQSFTDGVENSTTTLTSATANFVAGDVGKTITGDNIPAATTIASRTNSTTIVLSQAATSTSSGNNFTILNRLEVGGTGTVTSVSLTNNVTALFTSSVSNPTTSPTITLTPAASVGANTFYGNFTGFASTAGFGSASAARTSLGGTTVGQALFQLANPSAVSFPQITALNAVVTRTPAQVLSDIGGESALTFSTPLARSTNTISIPAATTLVAGHLTAADWTIFNGKVSSARNINTTAPLTGGGTLASDRTIAIPAATALVDGYLAQADFTTFTNKPPNTRTISTTAPLSGGGDLSANRTLSMLSATAARDGYLAQADFASFANQVPVIRQSSNAVSNVLTLADVTPPITRVILNTALTAPLTINLPQSQGYGFNIGYPFIEIVDVTVTPTNPGGVQTTVNRVTISRTAGINNDLVDGVTSIPLPMGAAYTRLNSNGLNRWNTAKYFVDSFKDATDSSKRVTVSFASWATSNVTRTFTPASAGNSVTVVPSTPANRQFLTGIGTDGSVSQDAVSPTELTPRQETVTGTNTSDTVITDDGSIDVVKLTTALTALRRYIFPNAANYLAGQPVHFIDTTGSPTDTNFVRVATASGNTFNGAAQIDISKPYFDATFYADPLTLSWTVSIPTSSSTGGLSIAPFTPVPRASTTATLTCSPSYAEEHNTLLLNTASTALVINGATTGKTGILHVSQDGNGNRALTLPTGSKTPSNGLGIISPALSTAASALDKLRWDFDGSSYTFTVLGLRYTAAAAAGFTTSDVDTVTAITTSGSANQGIDSGTRYGLASRLTANGGVTDGSSYIIGKIRAQLFRAGATATPSWNIKMAIYSNASGSPGTLIGLASSPVVAASLPTTESTNTDFDTNATVIGKRNQVTVTVTAGSPTLSGPNGTFDSANDTGCVISIVSGTGSIPVTALVGTMTGAGDLCNMVDSSGNPVNATVGGTATISISHVYWIVLYGDNPTFDAASYVSWPYKTTAGTSPQYYRSPTGAGWAAVASSRLAKYITFRT